MRIVPPLREPAIVDLIIPALNEEKSIGKVIEEIPSTRIRNILVCDNGSNDQTALVAKLAGAIVLSAPRRGYGSACLKGMDWLNSLPLPDQPDIVVFLDGDYSDYPQEIPLLLAPIIEGRAAFVIGSRVLGQREKGALTPHQRFGNWLATRIIRQLYHYHFTDLGPFRAIRWDVLRQLGMSDPNYGWTVEMQVRIAKAGLSATEVPVSYRRRIGISKVSGTIKGSLLAGYKILWTIFKRI